MQTEFKYAITSWINIRLDALGQLFCAIIAAYLVYGGSIAPQPSDIGFSLNMAVSFGYMVFHLVQCFNAFEVSSECPMIDIFFLALTHIVPTQAIGK